MSAILPIDKGLAHTLDHLRPSRDRVLAIAKSTEVLRRGSRGKDNRYWRRERSVRSGNTRLSAVMKVRWPPRRLAHLKGLMYQGTKEHGRVVRRSSWWMPFVGKTPHRSPATGLVPKFDEDQCRKVPSKLVRPPFATRGGRSRQYISTMSRCTKFKEDEELEEGAWTYRHTEQVDMASIRKSVWKIRGRISKIVGGDVWLGQGQPCNAPSSFRPKGAWLPVKRRRPTLDFLVRRDQCTAHMSTENLDATTSKTQLQSNGSSKFWCHKTFLFFLLHC